VTGEDWRWNIYVLTVVQVVMRVAITSIKPFIPLYLPELGVTAADQVAFWAGVVTSANFVAQAFTQPLWGTLADRYGRKPMVVRSIVAVGTFNLLVAWATNVYQFAVLRFLMGSMAGFNAAAIALVAVHTPPQQLGYAVGLVQAGQMAGTILGPAVGGVLAEWLGYRATFLVAGCLSLAMAPLVGWSVREEVPGRRGPADGPVGPERDRQAPDRACAGAVPAVADEEQVVDSWAVSSACTGEREPETAGTIPAADGEGRVKFAARLSLPMLAALVVVGCSQFGTQSADSLLALFVKEIYGGGQLNLAVSLAYALPASANLVLAPVWGRLGDRRGHWAVLQFALGGTALVVGLQGFSRSVAQFLVLRTVAGLFAGGVMPNAHAVIGRMSRRSRRGRAYGVAGSALAIGNFAGPMVGGIVAAFLGVRAVFWVTACLLLLVGAGVWGVQRTTAGVRNFLGGHAR